MSLPKNNFSLVFGVLVAAVLACNLPTNVQPDDVEAPAADVEFTSGNFFFFPDQATFDGESSPGSLLDFCSPSDVPVNGEGYLRVSETGVLDGFCSGESTDLTVQREGRLTGEYSEQYSDVSIKLETTRIFRPHPDGKVTAKIVLEGDADMQGKIAAGTGKYIYTCTAEGELVYCSGDRTSLTLSGTMPFQVEFRP